MEAISLKNSNQIEAYIFHGYYRLAINQLKERLELEPENPQWFMLALIATSEGCMPDSYNAISAKRKDYRVWPLVILISRALTPGVRVEKSVQLFNQAISLSPENAYLYYLRGKRLRDMGLFKQAISDFNNCLAINPCYAMVFIPRSFCYKSLGLHRLEMEDYYNLLNSMVCNREEVIRLMFQCQINLSKKELQLFALNLVYRWLNC